MTLELCSFGASVECLLIDIFKITNNSKAKVTDLFSFIYPPFNGPKSNRTILCFPRVSVTFTVINQMTSI